MVNEGVTKKRKVPEGAGADGKQARMLAGRTSAKQDDSKKAKGGKKGFFKNKPGKGKGKGKGKGGGKGKGKGGGDRKGGRGGDDDDEDGPRTTNDVVVEINQLWGKLNSKTIETAEAHEVSKSILGLLKGKVADMSLKHDASRAVQAVISRGSEEQKAEIVAELSEHFKDMCMSKYGRKVIMVILKESTAKQRRPVYAALKGFTRKLLTHKVASAVIDLLYEKANPAQRGAMLLDCCGRELVILESDPSACVSLDQCIERHPAKKVKILARLYELLLVLTQKQCVHTQLGMHILSGFMCHAEWKQVQDVVAGSAALVEQMASVRATKASENAMFYMLSYGNAKDRKVIMKGLKGQWADLAIREHGHRVVMRALDTVDDTTMLNKSVVADLLEDVGKLCQQKHGRRVILHVLAPNSSKYFDQYTVASNQPTLVPAEGSETGGGRMVPTSKKDPETRRKELLREMLPALTEWVHANAAVAMRCKHAADVVVEAAALATEKETKDWLMAALIEGAMTAMAAAPDAGSKKTDDDAMETDAAEEDEDEGEGEGEDRLEDTAVNHYIGRKTIRRLVDSHADAFGPPLLEELMDQLIPCANLRGGRFVVEALLKCEATAGDVAAALQKERKKIAEEGSKQLLLPLIDEQLKA